VVIFLEESLGSEFWGCLGRSNTLTPEMDKLATQEGMLFSNLYACGNRTVRGMEGVLSSFPPLPGDSIVKRDLSDNVETVARVMKRDGYSTVFLYGGRGLFDGMRSYAVRNGYDRFIEQKHFKDPAFTTVWGVCDEEVFMRAVDELHALAEKGQPFFGTILSVSNHKPYTYPKGRIPEDPAKQTRENAVKYSDFALGQFFRAARSGEDGRKGGRQKIAPTHAAQFFQIQIRQNRMRQLQRVAMLRRLLQDVPLRADVTCQRHHQLLANRIDRWIRHLRE